MRKLKIQFSCIISMSTATALTPTPNTQPVTTDTSTSKSETETKLVKYKPYRSICCTLYRDRSDFQNVLQELDLTHTQQNIIRLRYLAILENFKRRSRNYSIMFFVGHTIITVGSLFVPALLSIQNSDKNITLGGDNFNIHVYWATFVISLLVTIFNGLLTLFKVDKKYYFLTTTLERLRCEGWQYFGLTGRYSGHLINHQVPTHDNQFVHFIHFVEKIKMKQVEEEYFKADEKTTQSPIVTTQTNGPTNPEIYPLSPDKAVNDMTQANIIPGAVERAMKTLVKSQRTVDTTKKETNDIVIPITVPTPSPTPSPSPQLTFRETPMDEESGDI